MKQPSLKDFLNRKTEEYNQPSFIKDDPVSIPHLFKRQPDIEIAGFFAAVFAWGNRTTIIKKSHELMQAMDMAPHQFILQHDDNALKKLLSFKHRTFNTTDLLYFIEFLKFHYSKHKSLETAFTRGMEMNDATVENGLAGFHHYFFSLEHVPARTRKHIATPEKNSTCKRLNMFLRWMVRKDNCGVDFGIWNKLKPTDLIMPCDLHVDRVARKLKMITRKQTDWQTAVELTERLKEFDPTDPVKYDFALFGLGIEERWGDGAVLQDLF